jgi:hypothetical protein
MFSRRRLDVRARVVTGCPGGERTVIQARTFDLSRGGAGLTVTGELLAGSAVELYLRLPGQDKALYLQAVIARRRGFRVGLQFVRPTAEQRLLLSEVCYA